MVEELDRDYVRTAVGAGIPKKVVVARNVLRNALITPVTVLGLRIGYLMGGALVVAIAFIVVNIIVDMLYLLINPRIRSV